MVFCNFPEVKPLNGGTSIILTTYVFENKRFAINSRQMESLLRPYDHDLTLMVRKGGDPVVMPGWFVCEAVSMVITTKTVGLDNTLLATA